MIFVQITISIVNFYSQCRNSKKKKKKKSIQRAVRRSNDFHLMSARCQKRRFTLFIHGFVDLSQASPPLHSRSLFCRHGVASVCSWHAIRSCWNIASRGKRVQEFVSHNGRTCRGQVRQGLVCRAINNWHARVSWFLAALENLNRDWSFFNINLTLIIVWIVSK